MSEPNSRRGRGRPKTFDSVRALDLAIDTYWRDGVEVVSLNEICRRAGISKPGLYREFGGEDQFMSAALERYAARVLAPGLAGLEDNTEFAPAVDSLLAHLTRDATMTMPSGCLFVSMRSAPWRMGPATRAVVDQVSKCCLMAYSAWFARLSDHGAIALPVPLDVAASYLDAQVTWLTIQASSGVAPELVRAHGRLALGALNSGQRPG
ncbi:MAG: AcrR family transcriptional regulator [Bradymonadia bacterium]|jgi:AcrR family transcriptional regulator